MGDVSWQWDWYGFIGVDGWWLIADSESDSGSVAIHEMGSGESDEKYQNEYPQIIHGAGIFTYIYPINKYKWPKCR